MRALACVLALAPAAVAACPMPGDAVRIGYEDAWVEEFRPLRDGKVQRRQFDDGALISEDMLAHGLWPVERTDVANGVRQLLETIEAELPVPAPGVEGRFDVAFATREPRSSDTEVWYVRIGPDFPIVIGGCTLDVLAVTLGYADHPGAPPFLIETLYWSPALRASGIKSERGGTARTETFGDALSIETIEDGG
ncbi:MAG: hypothetical protein ACU0BF_10580 [Paracoccaceae bacterium]